MIHSYSRKGVHSADTHEVSQAHITDILDISNPSMIAGGLDEDEVTRFNLGAKFNLGRQGGAEGNNLYLRSEPRNVVLSESEVLYATHIKI